MPNTANFPAPYEPVQRAIQHTDPRVRIHHDQSEHVIRVDLPYDRVPEFAVERGGKLLMTAIPAGAIVTETQFWFTHPQHHRGYSSSGDAQVDGSGTYNDVAISEVVPFDCGGPATAILQLETSNVTQDIVGGSATGGALNLNDAGLPVYDGDRAYAINDNLIRLVIDFGGAGGEPTQGHGTFLIRYSPRNTTDEMVV